MNIRPFFAALMGASLFNMAASDKESRKDHPNVMMFLVDDWGAYDLSLTGSKLYETPNIDALADRSTVFSQGYVAYPRSVPSRYALMTGRHVAKPQKGAKADDRKVDAESYCIAMPFKSAGYETFLIGKWHLANKVTMPTDKGFDISIGAGRAGATNSYFAPFNGDGTENADKLIYGMEDATPGEYLTDYMTRKTVDYLNGAKDSDKPFFAICSYYAVHTPLEAKPEHIDKYTKKIADMHLGPDPMAPEEAGETKTQQDHPAYAGMIESVDESVGRIIETLKANGQYDNTVIVLLSDHGGLSNRGNKRELATTNRPLKGGKGHLYEGGIRVPFMIHTPGQTERSNSETPVVSLDLLPTLADICNAPVDSTAELDGVSIRTLLSPETANTDLDRCLYWHKASQRPKSTGDYVCSAIRCGNYKLLDFYLQGRVELYDVVADPGEHHNLAAEKPELTKEMMEKLNKWRSEAQVKMATKENAGFRGDGKERVSTPNRILNERKANRRAKENNANPTQAI